MKQYLDLLREVYNHGTIKGDRTGTGTKSIFGHQMRFDLAEGFPLVTTKKTNLRAIIAELLWFISGSSDERYLSLLTHGTSDISKNTIWSPNCLDMATKNPERFTGYNVGNMYGKSWRFLPCEPHGYTKIERKRASSDPYTEIHVQPEMTKIYKNPKTRMSASHGPFTTLGKQEEQFVIRFANTGAYRLVNHIYKTVKDLHAPTMEGVGYLGMMVPSTTTARKLHRVWQDMLIRVYNPRTNHEAYNDIAVCRRWHSFKNFYYDAMCLWGFQEFVDSGYEWQLDKDYYGATTYSPETTIFIPPSLNKSLNGGGAGYKVYLYDDKVFYSRKELNAYRGLSRKATLPSDLTVLEDSLDYVWRPKIYIDQLANAIEQLETNPNSRRIVVDSWNPRETGNAVLGICHPMFQFYVADGKLSCQLYQRSADIFLGVPFNIASYALLTMMIAQVTGLGLGEFVWTGGDCHLYSNHFEQAELQLSREPLPLPHMLINPSVGSIDLFTYEDFELVNYQAHPSIKAPIAV